MLNYTADQLKALNTDKNTNILVSASAGTGKTTVMVTRIVKLILSKNIPLQNIVVVTFTKLAAAEMKEKLFNMLTETNDEFAFSQRERIDVAQICTLHSFCADIVREYFYLVGIDPDFVVAEQNEAAALFKNALDDVLKEHYINDDSFNDLLIRLIKNRSDHILEDYLTKLYNFGQCIKDFPLWYDEKRLNINYQRVESFLNDKLITSQNSYKNVLADYISKLKITGAYLLVDYLEKIRSQLCASIDFELEKNLQLLYAVELPAFAQKLKKAPDVLSVDIAEFENLLEECKALKETVSDWLKELKIYEDIKRNSMFDIQNRVWLDKLIELTVQVTERFSQLKRERNLCDYNDLEHFTLKILEDKEALSQVKNKYSYIFVDEYQDINGIQEEILAKLKGEFNFFAVGDVKQSIYGFRQSDPDIFVQRSYEYTQNCQINDIVYMNDNFRCNKEIAEFVNMVFEALMTDNFGQVDYSNTGKLKANNIYSLCDGEKSSVISYIFYTKSENETPPQTIYDITAKQEEEISGDDVEGMYIAQKIKEIVGTKDSKGKVCTFSDIVILMRSVKTNAVNIFKQLIKAGIPAVIDYPTSAQTCEINDLISFMRILDNPLDDYEYVNALSSALGLLTYVQLAKISEAVPNTNSFYEKTENYINYPDADAIIVDKLQQFFNLTKKYRILSQTILSGELLLKLMEEKEYERYILALPDGETRSLRLSNFISCVANISLREFINYVNEVGVIDYANNYSGNAVKIMTMHASKGLEFDVVFLAGLSSPFAGDTDALLISKNLGPSLKYFDVDEKTATETPLFLAVKSEKVTKNLEEELRLLYVSLTRARKRLYLIASGTKAAGRIKFVPQDARCMFDWIDLALQKGKMSAYKDHVGDNFAVQYVLAESLKNDIKQDIVTAQSTNDSLAYLDWTYQFAEDTTLPLKVASSQIDKLAAQNFKEEEENEEYFGQIVNLDVPQDIDKSQLGKAYHKIFERCDLTNDDSVDNTKEALIDEGIIDVNLAQAIDTSLIKNCLKNPLFVQLFNGGKIYREQPFMAEMPYSSIFGSGSNQNIVLQGVIDLLVKNEDNAVLIDFKVTQNPTDIKKNYFKQINSYKKAAEQILKVKVKAYVFSVLNNELIEMNI